MTRSPYLLPDGNVQIAFSGGRSSGYMLHHILDANGGLREGVEVIFTNTGRERRESLDFGAEVSRRWQVGITVLEYVPRPPGFQIVGFQGAAMDGEPFEALIAHLGKIPARAPVSGVMVCSTRLKSRPAAKYLRSLGWKRWTCALGIRADEAHRSAKQPRERWRNWRPMVVAGVTKEDVAAFWAAQPFDLRLPNVGGKTLAGNCDGCPLKSEAVRAELIRREPERAAWWERMEESVRGRTRRAAGARFNLTQSWRELREYVERQGDWIFDAEDALCQADGGECTGEAA